MKKYDSYKDSGIEWIGEIPEHWAVSRIKYYLDYQKGKNPKEINFDKGSTSEIYLAMDFLRGEPRQILYVDDTDGYVKVDENEILLLWDGSNAGEFILSKRGILSSTMAVIYLDNIKKRYSWYYLKNFEPRLKENTIGMGIPHVNGEELKNGYITIPPISEQTAIAYFLDRKTSEIDDIIADKKRLLELYEEEKTAIINQAVTKGLDPNVPMKDSGIEWLGEIPEHWEVKKLKQFTKVLTGSTPKSTETSYWNGNINWVTTDDLGKLDGMYIYESRRKISEEGFKNSGTYMAPKGSVVISTRAPIGHLGILKIEACTNQGCKTIVGNLKFNTEFLYYHFYIAKGILNSYGVGTTFLELPTQTLKDYLVPFPSLSEQQSIVHHIESECSKIDFKKARTEELIELLTEYRTALISEAVTGKIKVTED